MIEDKLLKKLRFAADQKALIISAPESFRRRLEGVKYDETYTHAQAGTYDYVQIFAKQQADMEALLHQVASAGKFDCLFWACYPKLSGAVKSDMKRETVWKAMETIGLRPVSQVSIDDTWSAMRARPPEVVGK